jgi:hypothetical protein
MSAAVIPEGLVEARLLVGPGRRFPQEPADQHGPDAGQAVPHQETEYPPAHEEQREYSSGARRDAGRPQPSDPSPQQTPEYAPAVEGEGGHEVEEGERQVDEGEVPGHGAGGRAE